MTQVVERVPSAVSTTEIGNRSDEEKNADNGEKYPMTGSDSRRESLQAMCQSIGDRGDGFREVIPVGASKSSARFTGPHVNTNHVDLIG
jgi:hypothetical protein